jgi:WD40 repeat protein
MPSVFPPKLRFPAPVYTVAAAHAGTDILWGGGSPGGDCSVALCSALTPPERIQWLAGHRTVVIRARFLDDGSIVSFSWDSHFCRWTSTGELAASNKKGRRGRADAFAFSSVGNLAVAGDNDGVVTAWSLRDGLKAFEFKENARGLQVWSLAVTRDGKRLISGGSGGTIRAWGVKDYQRLSEIDLGWGHHVHALEMHPNGNVFAAAVARDGGAREGSRSRVALFDVATMTEVMSLDTDGHRPYCCAFSKDGHLLAAAGGGSDRGAHSSKSNCVIHVWRVDSGKEIAVLSGHTGLVRDLAFTPDSCWLLSAGWDNTLRAWPVDGLR